MTKKNNLENNIKSVHKIFFFIGICLILFCLRWQGVEAYKFNQIARNRVVSNQIDSIRGAIYSDDGTTLAYSEPRFDMYLWMDDLVFFEKKNLQTRGELISKVAPIIGIPAAEIESKIYEFFEKQGIKWIKIADSLTYNQWENLKSLKTDANSGVDLRGFTFQYSSERFYPEDKLASHVIGLVNKKDKTIFGTSGLERYWSDILNPILGYTIQERDARGSAVTSALFGTIEPKIGSSIYTSINKKLQKIVEEQLKNGVERYKAKTGTTIIMDPKTGRILAMANYPDYNPNKRDDVDPSVYGNIAITSPYENGSTGKALTAAAVIDLGLVNPDTMMPPHDGCILVHKDIAPICTYDKLPKKEISVRDCLATSDNICFYRLGLMMNVTDFYSYLDKFGAGKSSGVDFHPFEESFGVLPKPEKWTLGDIAAFSYGQGYQLNSLQATVAYGVLANFGVRMKPYLVSKLIDSEGKVNIYNPQPIQRVLKESSTEILNSMMANNYTVSIRPFEHWYNHLRAYNLGVKTGTGQIVVNGRYQDSVNATLIGYDLSPQRTFVMLVRLEDPQGSSVERLSSNNVRLVWLDTFNAVKEILGVPKK